MIVFQGCRYAYNEYKYGGRIMTDLFLQYFISDFRLWILDLIAEKKIEDPQSKI